MKTTDSGALKKEALTILAQKHGVDNLHQLCEKAGVSQQNIYSNFNGKYDISIKRMFKLANAMNADIVEVIQALHPDLYAENQENKIPVETECDQ